MPCTSDKQVQLDIHRSASLSLKPMDNAPCIRLQLSVPSPKVNITDLV